MTLVMTEDLGRPRATRYALHFIDANGHTVVLASGPTLDTVYCDAQVGLTGVLASLRDRTVYLSTRQTPDPEPLELSIEAYARIYATR